MPETVRAQALARQKSREASVHGEPFTRPSRRSRVVRAAVLVLSAILATMAVAHAAPANAAAAATPAESPILVLALAVFGAAVAATISRRRRFT